MVPRPASKCAASYTELVQTSPMAEGTWSCPSFFLLVVSQFSPQKPNAALCKTSPRQQLRRLQLMTALAWTTTTAFMLMLLTWPSQVTAVPMDKQQEALLLAIKPTWGVFSASYTWKAGNDCKNWQYLACDTQGNVIAFYFYEESRVSGVLPASLSGLRFLREIHFKRTKMGGQIPASIGLLTNLLILDLSSSRFSGTIPDTIGNLKKLSVLTMDYNNLAGPIPASIGSIGGSLTRLLLNNNRLQGSLPASLGLLTGLETLNLGRNDLAGVPPPSLGNLNSLVDLSLYDNALVGQFPAFITQLTRLAIVNLARNEFSGTIPDGIRNLRLLVQLNIPGNQFSGALPAALGSLPLLVVVQAGQNKFKAINARFSRQMQFVDLSDNLLTGRLPIWVVANSSNLFALSLGGNNFFGGLPAALGSFKQLAHLNLTGNPRLGGSFPAYLGNLRGLNELHLSKCGLTGVLPASIFPKLTFLGTLNLGGNFLQGSLPTALSAATSLVSLQLQNNRFSGVIAAQTFAGLKLEYLDLSGNSFRGPLPQLPRATPNIFFNAIQNFFSGSPKITIGSVSVCPNTGLSFGRIKRYLVAKNCLTSVVGCAINGQRSALTCTQYG